jgi:hypothetical protein
MAPDSRHASRNVFKILGSAISTADAEWQTVHNVRKTVQPRASWITRCRDIAQLGRVRFSRQRKRENEERERGREREKEKDRER